MISTTRLLDCVGFPVIGSSGLVGRVEEVWLDEADAPAGLAIELLDRRRAFLAVTDIAEVSSEGFAVTMSPNSRLLELELPRLAAAGSGETPAATWKTTDGTVDPAVFRDPSPQRDVPGSRLLTSRERRPLWQVIVGLYAFLVLLVTVLIGVDFLAAYMITGAPPY